MKIIALQAENIKRLVAVEIKPDGNIVEITGRNGSGKTSILDSIFWAVAGAGNVQARPIRDGQEQARVRVDLGELVVTRTFKRKGDGDYTTALTVQNADGAKYSSPQSMLDALVGELSFDPLEFTRLKPREQLDKLKGFVPGVDFDEVDRSNQLDYEDRRALNREIVRLEGQIDELENRLPPNLPMQPIDESEIIAQAEMARGADKHRDASQSLRDRAAELRTQAEQLEVQAAEHDEAAAELRVKLPPGLIDLAQELERVRKTNAAIADRNRLTELRSERNLKSANVGLLTKAMADRAAEKQQAIAAADMPVDGIGFGDGEILLNGVPFEQASDAEQLKASVAIAMAMNPKLRVIRVRDGSLLDAESMQRLVQMADGNDYQVWVETVSSDAPGAVVIEDGAVKAEVGGAA